ncbi:hypothetical protein BRYFOR_05722 [Marvinbryantia formatexigens DSM 14469]|uniref:Uncharacterized protein n=1 Tax=Marvinbryantia formatexigens DSM 14469 TaxID=478749 RepID=C6LAS8_9FIRM|nr:hypothetical protein [Marvinbryantia formatexigens]EET62059.1 hypothetical protein BRYFOR_05722 [Marvinbryantia formatexigens DSM 14469]UWO26572.1 hypothetical protein NQ534_08990 [Marvinbryantia formatexigens DSM 14469]SDH13519.1 hypothetical protein SAMN05660368_03902 [Marvinbryantia formatexigens]
MNYEELYTALQPQEKSVKDRLTQLQKLFKAVGKETESGDVKSLARDLGAMAETAELLSAALKEINDTVSGFDTREYFENGEFAEQMLAICEEKGVDVRGEFPVYEMFPYRVKLDAENQDIYLDRKKVQCMRPQSFVDTVKAGQEKLNKASFNALTFASELSDAYDMAVLKLNKRPESDIYLTSLYKFLAPMSRFRKDYDQQSYAFDLARLYAVRDDIGETKNGRKIQFGPSRKSSKAIRILDGDGKEQYLATIRFYKEGAEE